MRIKFFPPVGVEKVILGRIEIGKMFDEYFRKILMFKIVRLVLELTFSDYQISYKYS